MVVQTVCGGFTNIITGSLIPLTAYASVLTSIIIAISYMIGEMIQNPKMILWAKTEFIQIFISIGSALLITWFVSTFCTFNFSDIIALTMMSNPSQNPQQTVYEAAKTYLTNAALYTHKILLEQRYALAAFNVLEGRGRWYCIGASEKAWGFSILCAFNPSGYNKSPYAGVSLLSTAFNVSFSTALFSYLSSLNFLFILNYVYSGMLLLFLPFGIFLRSVPYMRTLGGLLLSLAFSFLLVYPAMLATFNNISGIMTDPVCPTAEGDLESKSTSWGGLGQIVESNMEGKLFDGCNYTQAIRDAGSAFIVGVFLPTIALIAAIASVRYVARLLGEEIDLSRIVQMV
jgi:hypothetical protein